MFDWSVVVAAEITPRRSDSVSHNGVRRENKTKKEETKKLVSSGTRANFCEYPNTLA